MIVGTNDMHGALAPQSVKTREPEGVTPIPYEKGGAAILGAHLKVLREDYGNRLLMLDGGDCFQGSLESNLQEGAPMVKLLNHLGFQASAVGNHEFDFGPVGPEGTPGDPVGALKARLAESHYTWLAANIIEKASGKMPAWPNFLPSRMVPVGRLKVGVIGLSTIETPTTTRPDHVEHLDFTPLKEATLREAQSLRTQGADLVVITAHAGLVCSRTHEKPYKVLQPGDEQGACAPEGEIVRLLESLPQGTVDAVVSGHTHTVVHHWIAGVPVIQAGTRNVNLNAMYLTYDLEQKKLVADRTRIEGPIPLCSRVFAHQNDCDGDRPAPKEGRGALVTPHFHGRALEPDASTQALLQSTFDEVAAAKRRVIGQAARPVDNPRERESEMGNLVAEAIRIKAGTDFGLVNPGGLRAPFEQGPVTYEALFRTLPFDNSISVLEVTGKELKQILRAAESGSKGFFPVSGLVLKVLDLHSPAKAEDVNGDGKKDLWEVDRLIEVRTLAGELIDDKKSYRLATLDFLVMGGDGLGWPMGQVPQSRISMNAAGLVRDAVEAHISRLGVMNSTSQPLVDPAKPRLIILKAYPAPAKHHAVPKKRRGGGGRSLTRRQIRQASGAAPASTPRNGKG